MGNKIGKYVEDNQSDLFIPSKGLKILANYDLNKASPYGLMLKMNNQPMWLKKKYIKLPYFYDACGRLSHVYRRCILYDLNILKYDSYYDSWIRASLVKKKTNERRTKSFKTNTGLSI